MTSNELFVNGEIFIGKFAPLSEISLGKHLKNYSEVVGALHDL